MDLQLIAKILKEEAEKGRKSPHTYCTIDLHGDVLMLVLREPVPYQEDEQTDLGPLKDFINEYKNR